jgi:adenosylcobinamide-phosphate synthase
MFSAFTVALALAALILEALFGYPALRHPVTWIGALIARLEQMLNRPEWTRERRRRNGAATLLVALAAAFAVAGVAREWAPKNLFGFVVLSLLASSLVAQRSLYDHVKAVAEALKNDGLEAGRAKVALIVGRDVAALDVAGVSRAAIESLAENFSDGVVAPAFWTAALGLPGGALYKAANTADSMIGHKNERYLHFGWAAARFDDLINLPASRLAASWIVLAAAFTRGAEWRNAWAAAWRDAKKHRSPNAGWPEAAMAGALGLKLAGPRVYGGVTVDDVYMGDGRATLDAEDILRALALYRRACAAQMMALALTLAFLML